MQEGPLGPDSQKKKKKQQSIQGMITVASVALLCLPLGMDTVHSPFHQFIFE